MLASAETVQIVADALRRHHVKTVVVDPVRRNRSVSNSIVLILAGHGFY